MNTCWSRRDWRGERRERASTGLGGQSVTSKPVVKGVKGLRVALRKVQSIEKRVNTESEAQIEV